MTATATDLLTELRPPRQMPGEPPRRWFTSASMDLIAWLDDNGQLLRCQLCYGNPLAEHALDWQPGRGLVHLAVDDGSQRLPAHKASPVLASAGPASVAAIRRDFAAASALIPEPLRAQVLALLETPDV